MKAPADTAKREIQRNYLAVMGITLWKERRQIGENLPAARIINPSGPIPADENTAPQQNDNNSALSPQEIANYTWEELENAVRKCTACPLHNTRNQSVFGAGNRNAEWLIIGEAPGAEEDQNGLPFIGPAGQLLTQMLLAINLRREDVYITNIIKSRPPQNRTPNNTEIATCRIYLERQIALIKPQIILAFGTIAAQTLLNTTTTITKLRGHIHQYEMIPLIATYHPSYLLRSPQEKRKAWDDLQLAQHVFDNRVIPDGQTP